MRKMITATLITLSAAATGCSEAKSEDAGPTVARSYNVGAFSGIEVAGPYDVEISTGGQPSVSGRGAERLMERTIVEVRGDTLVIRMKEQKGFSSFRWGNDKARFTVSAAALNSAKIAGSGAIKLDKASGQSFAGEVAGSGSLSLGSTNAQSVQLAIAGSGKVQSGSGAVQKAEYKIGGSGDIDAANLQAGDASISIAGSGSVRGKATGTANIKIMGSGDVELTGGAKCNVEKMGSGSARCS